MSSNVVTEYHNKNVKDRIRINNSWWKVEDKDQYQHIHPIVAKIEEEQNGLLHKRVLQQR